MSVKSSLVGDDIAEFCRRNHIRRLALFGSALRQDFTEDSDVDVLVQFRPGTRIGLIGLAGVELELSRLIGRKVDLNTPGSFGFDLRSEVESTAEVVYEQA